MPIAVAIPCEGGVLTATEVGVPPVMCSAIGLFVLLNATVALAGCDTGFARGTPLPVISMRKYRLPLLNAAKKASTSTDGSALVESPAGSVASGATPVQLKIAAPAIPLNKARPSSARLSRRRRAAREPNSSRPTPSSKAAGMPMNGAGIVPPPGGAPFTASTIGLPPAVPVVLRRTSLPSLSWATTYRCTEVAPGATVEASAALISIAAPPPVPPPTVTSAVPVGVAAPKLPPEQLLCVTCATCGGEPALMVAVMTDSAPVTVPPGRITLHPVEALLSVSR